MEKEKPPFSPSSSASSSAPKADPDPPFSHDISCMPDVPPRSSGHRRAHSEILSLPDDIAFDSDLGVVGCAPDAPSLSDEAEDDLFSMYLDMDKFSAPHLPPSSSSDGPPPETGDRPARVRHQHSQSMDGSTSIKAELLGAGSEGQSLTDAKKAMSAAKLADLALVDPKRAKRIWANRQSAARSKERKMRYIAELERKVQTLQTEATTLSAQLTMLQRDTTGLNAENGELKLRLQTMEQQVHLQDALNDALREEVQRLKMMTGQVFANGGPMMNFGPGSFGSNHQFYPQNHSMQSMLAAQQLQQLHLHSQQQQMHPNHLQHQHQQQQQTPLHSELKNKSPMLSTNQNQRGDGAFDVGNLMLKD